MQNFQNTLETRKRYCTVNVRCYYELMQVLSIMIKYITEQKKLFHYKLVLIMSLGYSLI